MAFLTQAANRGSISTGYDIDNSIKLEVNNNEWLYRNSPTAGNRKTFTLSLWLKRAVLGHIPAGGDEYLAGQGTSARFHFAGDTLRFMFAGNSTELESSRVYRDASAWYHIVLAVDTTQGTNTNRVKLYINGVQESWNNSDWPGQNTESDWMNTNDLYIGTKWGNNSTGDGDNDLSGYLSEVVLLDGTAASPTSFGEFDDNGIWKPVDVSGLTFGSEGFYANFDDSSALGADSSGNGNTLSLSNIAAADQATDTPTNNFATGNPLVYFASSTTLSNGATTLTKVADGWETLQSTIAVTSGKWYMEAQNISIDGATLSVFPAHQVAQGDNFPARIVNDGGISYYAAPGNLYRGLPSGLSDISYGASWTGTDVMGIALDMDNGKVYFAKANAWQYSGDPTSGATGTGAIDLIKPSEPHMMGYGLYTTGKSGAVNFGGYTPSSISSAASDGNGYGTFEYAPPTGYYALCTKNLAEFG